MKSTEVSRLSKRLNKQYAKNLETKEEKKQIKTQAELIREINTSICSVLTAKTQCSYKNLEQLLIRTDSPISQLDAKI